MVVLLLLLLLVMVVVSGTVKDTSSPIASPKKGGNSPFGVAASRTCSCMMDAKETLGAPAAAAAPPMFLFHAMTPSPVLYTNRGKL